jgi:hypothetical protein
MAAEKVLKKSLPKTAEKKPAPEVTAPNGSTRGLKWGLNLHHTLRRLMEEQPQKKLDDEKIIEFLLSEFPNRENKNILRNVREIRWRYNFGKLHEDKEGNPHPPKVPAVRYNPDGTVYEKKTKVPKLSEAEKAMKIEERREVEIEKRKAEVEALAKAEERVVKLKERIATRQSEWEKRNGALPTEAPKAKPKFAVKKK